MIPPMNSMMVYALGFELDSALAGATIKSVSQFPGGCTITLGGAPDPYIHLFFHGTGAELVTAKTLVVSGDNLTESMKPIHGAKILQARSLGTDRVLLISVESSGSWGEKGSYIMRLDFIPRVKPITLFREGEKQPVESLGPRRGRTPSCHDELPPAKRFSAIALPADPPAELLAALGTSAENATVPTHTGAREKVKSAASLIVRHIGGLDPLLAHVLSKKENGDLEGIWPLLREIGEALENKLWSWHIYDFPEEGKAGRSALYPIRLPVASEGVAFDDVHEAMHERARESVIPRFTDFLITRACTGARRDLKKTERLVQNLSKDIEEAERFKELRHFGDLLVTHRHHLRPGLDEVTVREFDGEQRVTIPLESKLSPDENIRMYFRRAKKGQKGLLIIRNRRRAVSNEASDQRALIASIEKLTDPNEIIGLLPRESGPATAGKGEKGPPRFRTYELDEHHTVYVGRSNNENDYLTHRFASPGDIWFHAQGVAGSHVILRRSAGSTPKKILEAAAGIAAYHSKARHSTTAPVIYTEKRYVRKPRKAKAGTAVYERGKTIFVEPSLPQDRPNSR